MDAAPRSFTDLPRDPELGVPVPFACGTEDAYADPGSVPSARALDKRRVTQCALSRICGVCGAGLGRPLALLGSPLEVGRNAFHFPPAHVACAEALVAAYAGVTAPVLGQDEVPDPWMLVTTASFEFVRAGREDLDRRPTFQPNALLSESRAG
jgi:hypothetical protein